MAIMTMAPYIAKKAAAESHTTTRHPTTSCSCSYLHHLIKSRLSTKSKKQKGGERGKKESEGEGHGHDGDLGARSEWDLEVGLLVTRLFF